MSAMRLFLALGLFSWLWASLQVRMSIKYLGVLRSLLGILSSPHSGLHGGRLVMSG
jgi:hypothetical protein